MNKICGYLKFFLKVKLVSSLRSFLVRLTFPKSKSTSGGILIINLQGLGDIVVFTSVLKHYRSAFPGQKIYLLIKEESRIGEIFEKNFVDEVFTLNYRSLATNPFYGYKLIKKLRRFNIETVINHDFSAAEILGKILSFELGARNIIGYEGMGIEFLRPYDFHQKLNLKFFSKKILPRFTQVIRRIDSRYDLLDRLPSAIAHYVAIFEALTDFRPKDYALSLPGEHQNKFKIQNYVILNLNASVPYKRWPLENFASIAKKITEQNFSIVLIGSKSEKFLSAKFKEIYSGPVINLTGETSLLDLVGLVRHSEFIVSGDTSLIHLGVALQKPTLCITGGGQFGMFADYGYSALNHWVYQRTSCFCDNWHCGKPLSNAPAPCVAAISIGKVENELVNLLSGLNNTTLPLSDFKTSFIDPPVRPSKTKIIFSGILFENYNFGRKSFEYSNFLLTLRSMPNLEVLFYPFDYIIQMGKKEFNRGLLDLIKSEKPDLFFAFMYTDELDISTLEKIKKLTQSIAWFADDHWRLDSYSKKYASHFTKAVTTWSEGIQNYARYGIKNIIRSQWASNPLVWKPVLIENQDIEVSFIGQHNSARDQIVKELRKSGVDVWVRGWGWPEGRLPGGDMVQAFSRSKINLNFNTPPNLWHPKILARLFLKRSLNKIRINWDFIGNFRSWRNTAIPQIKARPFEVVACKSFLISAFADDVDRYYTDKKEIVYYSNIPDLVKKISYYLSRPEERKKIAEAGYSRTTQDHTYFKRFIDIFKNLNLPYDYNP